jgi:TRAP-type C4-dicarboxylate transport system permease small subunit
MTYILPRAFIVLIGWAITCGLIKNWWPGVEPTMFYVAGASWAFAGLVCFRYLHRLRREAEHQRRPF